MKTSDDKNADLQMAENQALNYAREFSLLYKEEKQKRKALEIANFQLKHFSRSLKEKVKELDLKNEELNESYLGTLACLARAASYKDEETGEHIDRMSHYSKILAEVFGLSDLLVMQIFQSAPMHDIGKIGISESILKKQGKLTPSEFDEIKKHTTIGTRILSSSRAPIIKVAQRIAISHHEKWNGKGYPYGLAKDNIPIEGRIVALADTFDALTSPRPYKGAYPIALACNIIKREREVSFDPQVVDAFFSGLDDICRVKDTMRRKGIIESTILSARDSDDNLVFPTLADS